MKNYRRRAFLILAIIIVLGLLGGAYWGISRSDSNKTASAEKTKEKTKPQKTASKGQNKTAKAKTNIQGQKQPQKQQAQTPSGEQQTQQEAGTKDAAFIIKNAHTYKIDDSALNALITVSPFNDKQVQVDINLADHTQDLSYKGDIINQSTAEILLDGGDRVDLVWNDALHLKATPVNGYFSEKNLSDMKMLCDCLKNKSYTSSSGQSGTLPAPSTAAAFMPADGTYYNRTNGVFPHMCDIRVNKIDDKSFKFSIWEDSDADSKPANTQIFEENTAVFENQNDTTAVYRGQKYTLNFDCSKYGRIKLSGFDEAVQQGDTFLNMEITN